jgi:hypothetical protein
MISSELQNAIDNLQIRDVYLRSLRSECTEGFDPKYAEYETITVQTRHQVKTSELSQVNGDASILRVNVELGARWIDSGGSGDEAGESVCALIEAEFIAEYSVKDSLDSECIDEFALKNVSYHVWPYWRELLASQCLRMHLPKLVLPATQLAHNRIKKDASSEK